MKISDYSVNLNSRSSQKQTSVSSLSISLWGSKGRTGVDLSEKDGSPSELNNDLFNSSEGSLKNLYEKEIQGTTSISDRISSSNNSIDKLRYRLVDYFLRWLFGSDYEKTDIYELLHGSNYNSSQGFGGQISYTSFFFESEETTFQSQGTVINSEGKEMNFNMSFTLSRSISAMVHMDRSFGSTLLDPLVINLDSPITDISDQSFYFDLNCDGEAEEVTNLGKGSGFLALDKNGDNEINDGSELFGAISGNGFSDLCAYDEDDNNWIDENDSVFNQLKIFSVDSQGNKTLLSLKDAGVGAIYLASASTDYHFTRDVAENANAYLRRTGMFLYENGSCGTIQQVDLAVKGA